MYHNVHVNATTNSLRIIDLCVLCTVYEPANSETEMATAATTGVQVANDAVPTVYLGQEMLTKHSTLQANG